MEKFSRKTGKKWDSKQAKKEVDAYRTKNPKGLHWSMFGRDVIDEILKNKDCEGILIELATDDDGTEKVIISGVDAMGAKIANSDANASMTCPPFCNP